MEGRGGGGGGRKGSAGKIMSLQEFVSSMAPLIDLEKVFLSGSFLIFAVGSVGSRWNGLRRVNAVLVRCAGGGDIVGVGGELQEDGEERVRHAQPQVH